MSDEAHTLADSINEPVCSFAGDGADHGHVGPLLPRPSADDPRFWLCGRCFNTSAKATQILEADIAAVTPTDSAATMPPQSAEPPGIATQPRILDRVAEVLRWQGVVGEVATGGTIYLALTSRLLDKPVSLAVKGHSASGKSVTVDKVLALFPREAVIKMTGMSERALIYSEEEYVHRTIVIVEADALRERSDDNNLTAYFLRSLLSEGRIDYQVTERKGGKFVTRTITKEGPTNVVFTTTRPRVEYQNETRVLSLTTDDSRAQTARILVQLADEPEQTPDLAQWLHLQEWLQHHGERRVTIPYARRLAELVPPVAVRLRRDFGAVLTLIRAHALLHQLTRDRNDDGRIVATLDDYAAVRDLVADIVSEGVGAAVSETTRATVEAVADLALLHPEGVTAAVLGDKLGLDKSAARRRLNVAGGGDYTKNLEERRGRPGRWVIAEPLPEQVEILPPPTALADGGTVAVVPEGENYTPEEDYLLNKMHLDDPTEPHTWPEPEEEL